MSSSHNLRLTAAKLEDQPLKHFPCYIEASFGSEISDFLLGDKKDNELFTLMHRTDQAYDMLMAIKFAEENFLNLDIKQLTAKDFLTFLKELHGKTSYSLILGKKSAAKAGEYAQDSLHVLRNTGLENVGFEKTVTYSKHNHNILNKILSPQAGKAYQDFCKELEALKYSFSTLFSGDIEANFKAHGLTKHIGYQSYMRIQRHICPNHIPNQMLEFTNRLVVMIKNNENPYLCAAFIFYSLTTIHGFVNGNTRTARLFMNCIQMMLKTYPSLITAEDSGLYNMIIEKVDAQDLSLLASCLQASVPEENRHPLLNNKTYIPLHIATFYNTNHCIFVYSDHYQIFSSAEKGQQYQNHAIEIARLEVENSSQSIERINLLKVEMKNLVEITIDADYCYNYAKKIQNIHTDIAQYYYKRSQRFYTVAGNTEGAKKVIRDLLTLSMMKNAAKADDKKISYFWQPPASQTAPENKTYQSNHKGM
jgi:hypothetical protein